MLDTQEVSGSSPLPPTILPGQTPGAPRSKMLDTTRSAEDLRAAIGVALTSGVSESEILSMVATATADYSEPELPGFEDPGLPIYTELPPA